MSNVVVISDWENPDWRPEDSIQLSEDPLILWSAGLGDDPDYPLIWHWCLTARDGKGYWRASGYGGHEVVSVNPLTLSPSVLWPCCDLHGWIREGKWVST